MKVYIGRHAYNRLVERLSIKQPVRDDIFRDLNSLQPWYLQEREQTCLSHPQLGGFFVLCKDSKEPGCYFAKTFKSAAHTDGRGTQAEFVWYKNSNGKQ